MSRRFARAALPFLLGIAAFLVVGYVGGLWRGDSAGLEAMLEQPMHNLTARDVSLQVVVHHLLESAPAGSAIRVCRALAERPVSVKLTAPVSLHAVLESLAAQVGVTLSVAILGPGDRVLPTIPCPGGPGDYLVIGSPGGAG